MTRLDTQVRKIVDHIKTTGLEIEVEMDDLITVISAKGAIESIYIVLASRRGGLRYISAVDTFGEWTTLSEGSRCNMRAIAQWAEDVSRLGQPRSKLAA